MSEGGKGGTVRARGAGLTDAQHRCLAKLREVGFVRYTRIGWTAPDGSFVQGMVGSSVRALVRLGRVRIVEEERNCRYEPAE